MNILRTPLSLLEMENLLQEELRKNHKYIRILGDMNLSYEDYKCLLLKLKGIDKYRKNVKVVEQYRLSIIIACIFTLRYEKAEKIEYNKMKDILQHLSQHQVRFCMELFANTYEEYGIPTFGIDVHSIEDLFSLAAVHAGIPKQIQNDYFHLLDDSLHYTEMGSLQDRLYNDLSPHLRELYKYIDKENKVLAFYDCRNVFMDCKLNQLTEKAALEKYSWVSSDILRGMVKWCEEQKKERQTNIFHWIV